MSTTAYEIYGRGFGWSWRLRVQERVVATGGHHYDTSQEARQAVDQVRGAVASLTGDKEAFESEDISDPQTIVREDPTPSGEIPQDRNNWVWQLQTPERTLANSADRFPTESEARNALDRFLTRAAGALPMFMVGAEYEWRGALRSIEVGKPSLTGIVRELKRGFRHRKALRRLDTRIAVAGSRGKTSTTRRLDDVFNRRGYDTLTKITGNHPTLIHNGEVHPIERGGPRTTLYENISVIGEFAPELDAYAAEDIGIFENQGITEYTTRLINQQLINPDIVVLTNVRQDHNDTLGKTRTKIARSFARSISAGTHVVSGEQNPVLHDYMQEEIERRGGTIEQVEIPDRHEGMIGAETAHAIDAVLSFLDESPLPEGELEAFLDAIQPEWTRLPNGRIFNAAQVNDVESTEMVRQALVPDEKILPFVYLRRDRRGRTASFAEYVDLLYEQGHIDSAHVGGANTRAFAENTELPVTRHDNGNDAEKVLTDLLAEGNPVVIMGNTVDEFMREFEEAVSTQEQEATESIKPT
ncbi:Mur ligase family protein [Halorubrum sp. Hd13]|uniref:Mur ligase family protein n=1 Tax=Halorubrum sp. Hd13 TaxID=1480728 RepID=UPI001BAF23EE|nr:Mur ligase family protein [Halorubrum sp. Hd13]